MQDDKIQMVEMNFGGRKCKWYTRISKDNPDELKMQMNIHDLSTFVDKKN